MENEFEEKILKAMKRFEGKEVRVTLSGIVESRINMENFSYQLKGGVLKIEDFNENYLNIELDDIEKLYLELSENGYGLLIIILEWGLEIEMRTQSDKVIPMRDRILNELEKICTMEKALA